MKRVTEELFTQVKKPLYNRLTRPRVLANKFELSLKTILQIRGSKNFEEYCQQNRAQHPPVTFSLADEVLHLHKLTFRQDNDYIAPLTARQAILELQNKVLNKED